ncbi:MAG: hypothetical protein R3E96_07420 [Planctomycetota bacterium]
MKRHLSIALIGLSGLSYAQELDTPVVSTPDGPSVSLGLDMATAYYFRGYRQEDSGLILQPWSEVTFELSDDSPLSLTLGQWHSFHSEKSGATTGDSFVGTWYEADWYATLGWGRGDWSFGVTWTNYSSPAGAFATIDELTFSAGLDDSGEDSSGWQPSIAVSWKPTTAGPARPRTCNWAWPRSGPSTPAGTSWTSPFR